MRVITRSCVTKWHLFVLLLCRPKAVRLLRGRARTGGMCGAAMGAPRAKRGRVDELPYGHFLHDPAAGGTHTGLHLALPPRIRHYWNDARTRSSPRRIRGCGIRADDILLLRVDDHERRPDDAWMLPTASKSFSGAPWNLGGSTLLLVCCVHFSIYISLFKNIYIFLCHIYLLYLFTFYTSVCVL